MIILDHCASETHCYPPTLCPEIKTSQKYFPFAHNTQERAHSPELQVPADNDPGLSFSPLHSHTYPPSLDPGIKTTLESVYSTDNHEHLHTSGSLMTFLDLLDYYTVLVLIRILLHCTLLLLHPVLCHPLVTNLLDTPHLKYLLDL